MSNIIKRENTAIIAEGELTNTLNKLAVEAGKAVDAYVEAAPKLQIIANTILELLSKESEIANLEHKDMIKLFEVSAKAQWQPLDQFTKLFTQMNQLQEKLNINKELDALRELTDEITKAKHEAHEIKAKEDEDVNEHDNETEVLTSNILNDLLKK